jgi:hypothetical protein
MLAKKVYARHPIVRVLASVGVRVAEKRRRPMNAASGPVGFHHPICNCPQVADAILLERVQQELRGLL